MEHLHTLIVASGQQSPQRHRVTLYCDSCDYEIERVFTTEKSKTNIWE